ARAFPPMASPGSKRTSASAGPRPWNRRSLRASRPGRTGSSSVRTRSAMRARSSATAAASGRRSIPRGFSGASRCARRDDKESTMTIQSVDYSTKIPNNVNLTEDRQVLRALESWHPGYIDWWTTMGPEGFQEALVYLRTAVSVDPKGWAKFDYVKMPDYRWGILLAPQEDGRKIPSGHHFGEPAWQEGPGEYREIG